MRHIRVRLRRQMGYYIFSVAIAMVAASIAAVGSARSSINAFNDNVGKNLGNQLQTTLDGLDAYIQKNYTDLVNGQSVTGVTNATSPTVQELKMLKHLSASAPLTPKLGGAYNIVVRRVPAGCVASACKLAGAVYLQNPIIGPSGQNSNVRLLNAAADASPNGQIGFSRIDTVTRTNAPQVFFPTGATEPNPDTAKRAGILYGTTERTAVTNSRYWQAPVDTASQLPATSNNLGDGRLVKENNRPYIYEGVNTGLNNGWIELFSSGWASTNVSMGQGAGFESTNSAVSTMQNNVFVGMNAGALAGSPGGNSANNTFVGAEAGKTNTGDNNVFVGRSTGSANTVGSRNTFVGAEAGKFTQTGNDNLYMGYQAGLNANGTDGNVFLGAYTGMSNTVGVNNVFTGTSAGRSNTAGSSNVFSGTDAGRSNDTGSRNVYIGYGSGSLGTSASDNVHIGYKAGAVSTASQNVFVGPTAGRDNTTGSDNTFIGTQTGLTNTTGTSNTFLGDSAGLWNTTGSFNVYVGPSAGLSSNTANHNVLIGLGAGFNLSDSVGNTLVGDVAAQSANSGSYNTLLGFNSSFANGVTNSMALGSYATATQSNTVVIGDANILKIGGSAPWSNTSDRRLKTDIRDSQRGLAFVRQLRPVDYTLISNQKPETGFIAQEVEAIEPDFPGLLKPQNKDDHYALAYTDFIPSMVKAIQELDAQQQASASLWDDARVVWGVAAVLGLLGGLMALLLWLSRRLTREVAQLKALVQA